MEQPKVQYSDEDLQEFKTLIDARIEKAQEELLFTRQQIEELSESGFNQQNGDMYDDSGAHADLEFMQRMSVRQQKFIDDLQKALLRIQNKTYGVCIVTGELIPKERLRVVPHATKSVDGKILANKNKPSAAAEPGAETASFSTDDEDRRPAIKPVSDKVRIPGSKRASGEEDWELDNETLEDAGYRTPPGDDDEN